ncbi:MAG TPA: energy transducer TonB [Candidatus Acidoferrum sp.]|jgi:TonB family protein
MTTMIADSTQGKTMGVGLNAGRARSSNPEAWKQHIGNRQVPARLALLPDSKPRWDRIGVSAGVQVAAATFFLLIPLMYPEGMKTALHYNSVEIAQPMTEIPVAPPPPPPAAVKPVIKKPDVPPPVVETPQLNPKQQHIFKNLAPKTIQPKIEKVDVKVPDMTPTFDAAKIDTKDNGPKRPKEDVKVGLMNNSTGSAAPATVKAPVDKVQTGGFGDPNGMPGKGDPNHATNVNRLGSPALPGGEGYGNGTGGKEGIRGTVASTGFGNGVATPPTGGGGTKKAVVVASGFGDAAAVTEAPKKKTQAGGPPDTGIVIQDKPRPEYTAEARNLRIEGDVVLDLVFLANGSIQINRVVSGLGHGLDEAAQRAAQQIKFKPAKRENEPVDFPARVRIEFRLAY